LPPDNVEEYKTEFGYMGSFLYAGVLQLRAQEHKQQAAALAGMRQHV
jgi:hypothetical protein